MIQDFIKFIQSVPMDTWKALGAFLVAGLGLSVIVQSIRHWVNIQSDKVITNLLMFLASLAALTDYVVNFVGQNPSVIGTHAAGILAASVPMYRYIVKPGYEWLLKTIEDTKAGRLVNQPQAVGVSEAEVNLEVAAP